MGKIWRWLTTGTTRAGGSFGYMTVLEDGSRFRSRMQRMTRLWRTIMQHRTVHPVPITYVFASGVGLVIGLILQFTLGFPWWIPVIAMPILAWLVFFSSIWWPTRGTRRSLRQELRDITRPAEARDRHRAQHERVLRESTFPWLWFAHVSDEHVLPGGATSGDEVRAIHLNGVEFDAAGNSVATHPEYSVTVYAPTCGREDAASDLRGELVSARYLRSVESFGSDSMPLDERSHMFEESMRRAHDEFEALGWQTTSVRVGGAVYEAHEVQTEYVWAALFEVQSHWVLASIRGGSPQQPLEFARVHDRARFIERSLARW